MEESESLFYRLLRAEDEGSVTDILRQAGLLDDEAQWLPLGGMENNFGIVGNQQTDATAALAEKIINSIDAVLLLEAFKRGVDPEGSQAPGSMGEAVEQFLGIRGGRLENLTASERTSLAERIQLVAVGSKEDPCYLVVDQGEGQTPQSFSDTFLSLSRSNKIKIPFVQGRFNAGGTGVLQFCGTKNYQLIASRRAPEAPRRQGDDSAALWGFTLVRRLPPSAGRKNSMYVYLAPSGRIPSFGAESVRVLPAASPGGGRPTPYERELPFGTVIKLYNYRWKGRTLATTEARFELERLLHSPCLPFRIVETRSGYRAHYFATTVSGVWVRVRGSAEEESAQVEEGFPAYAEVDIPGIGRLPYWVVVFREDVGARRIPSGVFFTLNGQVHGSLPRDFVSREVKFDYLAPHILVSVDCTGMDNRVREDFFMASRDRLRRNEAYDAMSETLRTLLADHPGLRELNARRRTKRIEEALQNETGGQEAFQDLIRSDRSLAALFGAGEQLVTSIGPTTEPKKYKGRRFPSFFRIAKEPASGLVKMCPINWKCRVDFETDASNDYFDRADSPGTITVTPDGILESRSLWNGRCVTYFRAPQHAQPGDDIEVQVQVADDERAVRGGPFVCEFRLHVDPERKHKPGGGVPGSNGGTGDGPLSAPRLSVPNVYEVRRDGWGDHEMGPNDAIRIKSTGIDQGGYDFYINMDNIFLVNEKRQSRTEDPRVLEYWFKYGLALAAASMLRIPELEHRDAVQPPNETIENLTAGLARVIIPILRRLHGGPWAARPPMGAE